MNHPVYITSIAMANAHGNNTEDVWNACLEGHPSFGSIPHIADSEIGDGGWFGNCDHEALAKRLTGRVRAQTDPSTQVALALSDDIISDIDKSIDRNDTGVFLGNTYGGLTFAQRELFNLYKKGSRSVSPYQSFAWFYSVNTGQISIRHKLKGPGGTLTTEACGGLDAISAAAHVTGESGRSMITGAIDGTESPFGIGSMFSNPEVLRPGNDWSRYSPYATETKGYIPGFGGALLAIQDRPLQSFSDSNKHQVMIVSSQSAFDPTHSAATIRQLVEDLLRNTNVSRTDIGVIFGDALGTSSADMKEIEALRRVFGEALPPITAPKSGFGRLFSASSATDVALAAKSLINEVIPPTVTSSESDSNPREIDLVMGKPRALDRGAAIVLSTGRGGYCSAMLLVAG